MLQRVFWYGNAEHKISIAHYSSSFGGTGANQPTNNSNKPTAIKEIMRSMPFELASSTKNSLHTTMPIRLAPTIHSVRLCLRLAKTIITMAVIAQIIDSVACTPNDASRAWAFHSMPL